MDHSGIRQNSFSWQSKDGRDGESHYGSHSKSGTTESKFFQQIFFEMLLDRLPRWLALVTGINCFELGTLRMNAAGR
jgi:hypothetical protein